MQLKKSGAMDAWYKIARPCVTAYLREPHHASPTSVFTAGTPYSQEIGET